MRDHMFRIILYVNILSMHLMEFYYAKCISLFDTRGEWKCHRDQRLIQGVFTKESDSTSKVGRK